MPELSVASFNTHAGMDGWGRPYDLTEACRRLDSDVIVLQEVFAPLGATSQADDIAGDLGYTAVELPLAKAWRRKVPIVAGRGWEPRRVLPLREKALRVGGRADSGSADLVGYEEGTWGLAVLCRPPIVRTESLPLGRLRRDFTHRSALLVELGTGGDDHDVFTVIGTHMAHLTAGSPKLLRRLLADLPPKTRPAALAGDMNLWGPPLTLLFPGWSRAVKGRTWPAWWPHSQADHILITRAVNVEEAQVIRVGNSDHRAVRARLSWH
jgi:endonuclease/exonuclease/phosphatase family metal-dependent hydrolase